MASKERNAGPPKRKERRLYNEEVDESAALIDREPADIEGEAPAQDNEPLQRIEGPDEPEAPVFEE